VDDAMVELCKETTAEKGDIDEGSDIFIVVGEENNQKQNTSWAQCMACFEIISNLLSEKEFREENVTLESCNG
jgi:proteasome assembly chaperone (PAC2) family protein